MDKPTFSIAFIGAGNVATHLAKIFCLQGFQINAIYSRNLNTANKLVSLIGAGHATNSLDFSESKAQLFIIAVPDEAIPLVVEKIKLPKHSFIVHTSGSVPMATLGLLQNKIGVFYPLQTFTNGKKVDFSKIPICIETESKELRRQLLKLANCISHNVVEVDSTKRKQLHLAAVFACNFTNYLLGISDALLQQSNLPFTILRPLVMETLEKAFEIGTVKAQTGPAVREDLSTMAQHLELLKNNQEYYDLYKRLSSNIGHKFNKKKPF